MLAQLCQNCKPKFHSGVFLRRILRRGGRSAPPAGRRGRRPLRFYRCLFAGSTLYFLLKRAETTLMGGSFAWYARLESNQRPTESESVTLSN